MSLDDLQLFQEICETVLKRGNFGLFAAARTGDPSPRARQIYLEVHDNVELEGPLPGGSGEKPEGGGIRLQDHGNPVRYRNIWVMKAGD